MPQSVYHQKITQIHVQKEPGWVPELIWVLWKREKSLFLAGIQSLALPTHSVVAIQTMLSWLMKHLNT